MFKIWINISWKIIFWIMFLGIHINLFLILLGRKILFNCDWPIYQLDNKIQPNWDLITKTCHTFRHTGDVSDSWGRVNGIIDYYGQHNQELMKYHGIEKLITRFKNWKFIHNRTWTLFQPRPAWDRQLWSVPRTEQDSDVDVVHVVVPSVHV